MVKRPRPRDMLIRVSIAFGTTTAEFNENRAFVNFADGGGWLARKRDYERLIDQCHYFLNLRHLAMLEAIVLKHVPV